jgi:hypothetical protein
MSLYVAIAVGGMLYWQTERFVDSALAVLIILVVDMYRQLSQMRELLDDADEFVVAPKREVAGEIAKARREAGGP